MKKSQLKQLIKEQVIKIYEEIEKFKIMWDDAIPSNQTFNSKQEAWDFAEEHKGESQEIRINDEGNDEWYNAISYYNPDDKRNYSEFSVDPISNQLNEYKTEPLWIKKMIKESNMVFDKKIVKPTEEEVKEWIRTRKQKRKELDDILMKSGVYGFKRK